MHISTWARLGVAGAAIGFSSVPTPSQAGSETQLFAFNDQHYQQGLNPEGTLLQLGGRLYGVTEGGGAANYGTIFTLDADGHHRVIHAFLGGAAGSYPFAGLIGLGGHLYGTTRYGGDSSCDYGNGCGTVLPSTRTALFPLSPASTAAPTARFPRPIWLQ